MEYLSNQGSLTRNIMLDSLFNHSQLAYYLTYMSEQLRLHDPSVYANAMVDNFFRIDGCILFSLWEKYGNSVL
jgi:hypothetical protein